METILEQQRRLHEERDRLIKAMVDEFLVKKAAVSIFTHTNVFQTFLKLKICL